MAKAKKKKVKRDTYQEVTDRILAALDQGTVPWQKPWKIDGRPHQNLISKKPYRGMNIWLTSLSAMEHGFSSPYWVSFKQAKDLGGHVKKGEKSTMIVFYKFIDIKEKNDEGEDETKTLPLLRFYYVFNLDQTEGIDPEKIPEGLKELDHDPIECCEEVVKHYPPVMPRIHHGGNRASYNPVMDDIHMPKMGQFDTPEAYYSTLFHELTHSTGHETRLKREEVAKTHLFGSHGYGKEELVAEMGAAYLCGHCDIENKTIKNSASYIDGWRKKIKEDKYMVIRAAARAQRAADFILGIKKEKKDENPYEGNRKEW
jgi:antirestriction protein ArdC